MWLEGSRVNDWTTRMPEMSSASVAVTSPSRSRTRRYARFERERNQTVTRGHQREHDERCEREAPVEEEEDDRRSDEEQRVLHEARHAVGDELVERLDVVRDAADDRSGAVSLVVAEREALEVCEQVDAKVGEASFADPAGEVGLRSGQREGRDPGEHERDDDLGQRLEIAFRDPVVDRELREVRRAGARPT